MRTRCDLINSLTLFHHLVNVPTSMSVLHVAFHFRSYLAASEKSHKEYLEEFTPDLCHHDVGFSRNRFSSYKHCNMLAHLEAA